MRDVLVKRRVFLDSTGRVVEIPDSIVQKLQKGQRVKRGGRYFLLPSKRTKAFWRGE